MVVDVTVLSVLVSFVIPLLVGVVTKEVTNPSVKFVVLAVLAGALAVGTTAVAAGGLVLGTVVLTTAINTGIAIASYFGVWKPTGVADAVQDNTDAKGIGFTIVSK